MVFIETPIFTEQSSGDLFTDENKDRIMNDELFQQLKQSVGQMNAIKRGELAPGRIRVVEPRTLARGAREKLGMTQEQFARALHTSVSTVRSWEQGKRTPTPATQLLLKVAKEHPDEVLECV